jgi:hypothetical protein
MTTEELRLKLVKDQEADALAKSREQLGLPPYTEEQWAQWHARWGGDAA